jgi:hypothetical protein
MTTITFDTHKFIRKLRLAGFEESQAEAVSEAFSEAQGESDLATKRDIEELRLNTRLDIETLKADLIKWIAGLLLAQAALVATLVKLL